MQLAASVLEQAELLVHRAHLAETTRLASEGVALRPCGVELDRCAELIHPYNGVISGRLGRGAPRDAT